MMGTHGVKIKTSDYPRARWLTPDGDLTTRVFHAGTDSRERAEAVAANIARDHAPTVEWARAEPIGGAA